MIDLTHGCSVLKTLNSQRSKHGQFHCKRGDKNQTAKSEKLEFHPIKPSFQDLFPWDYQFNAFSVLMTAILESVFVFRTLDLGAEN